MISKDALKSHSMSSSIEAFRFMVSDLGLQLWLIAEDTRTHLSEGYEHSHIQLQSYSKACSQWSPERKNYFPANTGFLSVFYPPVFQFSKVHEDKMEFSGEGGMN